MPEIVQEISPIGGAQRPAGGNIAAARPIIEQSVSSSGINRGESTGRPVIDQTVSPGGTGGGMLSATAREMLANLDKHGSVKAPPAPETVIEEAAKEAPAAAVAPAVAAPSPEPAATAPAPAPAPAVDEHRAVNERLTRRNAELLAEVESLKKQPKGDAPVSHKLLTEAERLYLEDTSGALRRFIAASLGIDDPAHKDVDAELSAIYQDMTAKELGVDLDESKRAIREAARTRQLLARDKKEREAPKPEPAAPAGPAEPNAEHVSLVAGHLKPLADAYPLTMKLAERMHGAKPEALLLRVIHEGFATGEFDPKTNDDKLVEQALKKTEARYQALADAFGVAPATSTAPPTTATETANQVAAQTKVSPSITNASASVAPATPPAKQSSTTAPDDDYRAQRPGETEHQRRLRIAKRHMPD